MRRRRTGWALVALAVAVTTGWLWRGPAPEVPADAPLRARRVAVPVVRPWVAPVDPLAEPELLWVRVALVSPDRWSPVRPEPMSHAPWAYWPDRDEADWPDLATTEAMEALVAALRDDVDLLAVPLEPFVDDARADGLLPLPEQGFDDPWTGLMAAQAAYAELFVEENVDEAEGYARLADRHRLAAQIVADWPDHPAGDYARLVLLNGSLWLEQGAEEGHPRPDDTIDAAGAREVARDLLERCEDPEMIAEAAAWLAASGDEAALELLGDVFDRTGRAAPTVAAGALGIAVRAGRWDEALEWAETLEATADGDGAAADWARAAADVAGHRAATGWRASLAAEVLRCAGPDTADEEVVFDVAGVQWRVRGDTPLAECLGGFVPPEDGPVDAVVTVVATR